MNCRKMIYHPSEFDAHLRRCNSQPTKAAYSHKCHSLMRIIKVSKYFTSALFSLKDLGLHFSKTFNFSKPTLPQVARAGKLIGLLEKVLKTGRQVVNTQNPHSTYHRMPLSFFISCSSVIYSRFRMLDEDLQGDFRTFSHG